MRISRRLVRVLVPVLALLPLVAAGQPARVANGTLAEAAPPVDPAPPTREEREAARRARQALLEQERETFDEALRLFQSEVEEYRVDTRQLIERTYEERRARISEQYEEALRRQEVDERADRLDAIALFERFLERYPDDARYTPDAMTRLAELYYEKSIDDQQLALAESTRRASLGTEDDLLDTTRSFDKSIALYRAIVERFPEYRLIDSIHYLLGWCLGEQGEAEESRDTFLALVQKYPRSRYVPEAWVRIGEYYFDYTGDDVDEKLRDAIYAYNKAVEHGDSPLFDKALYKLGWTHYRLNEFGPSVAAFVRLVDHYDRRKAEGEEGGGDLRAEALQYTAISFSDETWGGVDRLTDYFTRIGNRGWEHELYRRLGDVLFDSTRYTEAVAAYRIVLQRNPLAADAPQVQEKIVQAFARDQNRNAAFAERGKLVREYGEDSAWAEANRDDPEALQTARELVERAYLASAQFHHAQAMEYEKASAEEGASAEQRAQQAALALQSWRAAAEAYGGYMKAFPHSKRIHDIRYYHAETLYNSLQFLAAAEEYARVRDSSSDEKVIAGAAYSVVLSLQREIEKQEALGKLAKREPCTPEACAAVESFEPLEMPELRRRLIEEADTYMARAPEAEDAPLLSYKAAQTWFAYFHFDEALRRYEEVVSRFPEHEVALFAWEDMIISWLLRKDWEQVEALADRVLRESRAVQDDPKKLAEKRLLKYGARFNRANALMKEEKWDEASALYVSIVDDTEAETARWGRWDNADKALYNAATCFVEARRFDSAMRTFERLFTDYADSSLAENALFYVAFNAEKAFDFEKAIDGYVTLVERYPDSKDRAAALFNAAKLLEALQRYPEAARAYRRYAELFPNEEDAPDQAYQAAVIYQRTRDFRRMIDELERFVRDFGRVGSQAEKVVQARLKIGLAWRDLGNEANALRAFEETVREFDRRGLKHDNYLAAQAAAEAAFWLAEKRFADFERLRYDPKGRGSRLEKSMTEQLEMLAKALEDVKKAYSEVILKYRWPEWMMASLYRIGHADEKFATKLIESPCPADVRSIGGEDACIEYRIMLEEQMMPINDRAVTAYETAADRAQELRIVNDWTKLTMEKVCQYTPSKCRSLKEPRGQMLFSDLSSRPLASDAEGAPVDAGLLAELLKSAPAPVEPSEEAESKTPSAPPVPGGIGAPDLVPPAASASTGEGL